MFVPFGKYPSGLMLFYCRVRVQMLGGLGSSFPFDEVRVRDSNLAHIKAFFRHHIADKGMVFVGGDDAAGS